MNEHKKLLAYLLVYYQFETINFKFGKCSNISKLSKTNINDIKNWLHIELTTGRYLLTHIHGIVGINELAEDYKI